MAILWGSEDRQEFYDKLRNISFSNVELKPSRLIPYDESPTEIQRQIELSVTNGMGYLDLNNSLEIVNSNPYIPKLTLPTVLGAGIVPLYLGGSKTTEQNAIFNNPCCEVYLNRHDQISLPIPNRTILDELRLQQRIFGINEARKRNPRALFRVA